MSSDDYQVQDIYRYARKSYKKNCRRGSHENGGGNTEDDNVESDNSPRSDRAAVDMPSCSCDVDRDGDVASILHKKCPVITLARQQLQRLLDDTDKILCDNTRCCRSVYDFLCICREILKGQNKRTCVLICLIAIAFFFGILFGAASCGSYLGQFYSPILTCLDNLFIPETSVNIEQYCAVAGGVTVGTTMGHLAGEAISSLFGDGRHRQQIEEALPRNYQLGTEPTGPCAYEIAQFLNCASNRENLQECEQFNEALRDCKRWNRLP